MRPRDQAVDEFPDIVTFNNNEYYTNDYYFTLITDDNNELGIAIFIKNFDETEKQNYWHITFILLDASIGEYDVNTKLNEIYLDSYDSYSEYEKLPITELNKVFYE